MAALSSLFAKRYLLSKKSHSVINIVSWISAFAVGIPVAAMIILLSVFNGFEGVVKSLYGEFDPDILITPAQGKVFGYEEIDIDKIGSSDVVSAWSFIMEDNALLEYREQQFIGTVRGVDENYPEVIPVEGMIVEGKYEPYFGEMMQALVGRGLAYNLEVNTAFYDPIRIFVPRRGSYSSVLPLDIYREGRIFPSGIYALDAETDSKYIIVPLQFTQEIFDYPGKASGLMIRLVPGTNEKQAVRELRNIAGESFEVKTRYQQKASLYRIMEYEKWGIFIIALLVMVIASFSIVGSLAMLIIEKRDDCRTILNMGGTVKFIRSIFVKEGMMICLCGAVGGLILGLLLCIVQMKTGIITIPADTFLVDEYPVMIKAADIIVVAISFMTVGYLISKVTVRTMIKKEEIFI